MSSAKTFKKNLADACEEYIKIFGANKNLYRVICSAIDGLKPVERRFIYNLYTGKGRTKFIKMAVAAAETCARFHPHGDVSVKDVGANLASPIFNNVSPVEGHGNFGSYKSDEAGAARYIECRLSKYAQKCFFEDFESSNVPMKMTYNEGEYEPEVLPARYPHALFNPKLAGIGYASASNIPPFNISEVLQATIKLIKDPKAKICLIPDSPTGADIVDDGQFEEINRTGYGTFTLKGHIEVNEIENTLTITSIPLQITIDKIIRNIVEMKEKKMFDEIINIKDYSKNKTGVKCIIYLNNTANPYKTIEKLYKKGTGLKKTYPVGLRMIDDYKEYDYSIKDFLLQWIEYRRDMVVSIFNTKLVKAIEDQNMNDILLFVLDKDHAEETIKIVKQSENKKEIVSKLMKKYGMNSQQAETIANMRVQGFSKEAYRNYQERKIELKEEINRLDNILDSDSEIDKIIIEQLEEGIKLFGGPRKSKIVKEEKEEDKKIPQTEHIIGISKDGYVKKVSIDERQIGQVGNSTSQIMVLQALNTEDILVFDSTGSVSRIPISSIPNMSIKDEGILLGRYFSVQGKVVSVLLEPTDSELKKRGKDLYITFLTKEGFVKRTLLTEFTNVNGSMSAIKIPPSDELVAAEFTSDNTSKDMVIYTNRGNGIRIDINIFPISHAAARGTRQMTLQENEWCIGFDKINPDKKYMLYVTSAGRAKLTEIKYFPVMKRKDDVLSLINLENGETLIGIRSVNKNDRAMIYKKKSNPEVIDLVDVKVTTRVAKAEKVVKTPKGDYVLSFAIIMPD